jgi:hypothetical protein
MNWNPSWANAIASIESQGSGGYSAVGPTTQKGNRAYGKYQVMDFNIPTWTEKHLGKRLTPDQFLNSPEAQETVFKGEFGSYVSKYGSPQDAASVWFTGRPQSEGSNRSDVLGTTGSGYVNKFNNALGTGATLTGGQPMMQPEQKPTGLLGGLFSDPDKRARLAMALEGMTLNPNRALLASLQGGIEQRGLDKKEAAAEAKSLAQRNKTLEFLAGQEGGEQFVRLADAAGVPTAIKAYMESKKAPKAGQDLQKYELAKSQGFEGTYLDFEKALQGFEPGPGLKALDETFAKTLDGTSAQQLAAARQDTASVAKVLEQLEAGENLTGPLIGSIPEELRALIYPESVQAQQLVEQVVQKNLRAILGGQFAQKEGELLVKRAYNPKLNPQQNAARLRSLLLTLDAAAKGKQEQTDYFFNNNYSLRGYTGFAGVPTYEDFNNALDNAPNGITEKRNQGGSTRIIFDESGNEVKQ